MPVVVSATMPMVPVGAMAVAPFERLRPKRSCQWCARSSASRTPPRTDASPPSPPASRSAHRAAGQNSWTPMTPRPRRRFFSRVSATAPHGRSEYSVPAVRNSTASLTALRSRVGRPNRLSTRRAEVAHVGVVGRRDLRAGVTQHLAGLVAAVHREPGSAVVPASCRRPCGRRGRRARGRRESRRRTPRRSDRQRHADVRHVERRGRVVVGRLLVTQPLRVILDANERIHVGVPPRQPGPDRRTPRTRPASCGVRSR